MMRRTFVGTCTLALLAALAGGEARPASTPAPAPGPGGPAAFYVATNGRDAFSGRRPRRMAGGTDGPFATLERARDAIRALKASGGMSPQGAVVYIRGGIYTRDSTFELTSEDGGTAQGPVVYAPYENETVRLVGGRQVRGFRRINDPLILARIQEPFRKRVLQANLASQGIQDLGEMTPRGFGSPIRPAPLEVFFEGQPMPLARWPNTGWARIAGAPAGRDGGRFTYDGDDPARWIGAPEVWMHGFWTYDWADSYVKVREIDTSSREIATEPPHGVYGYSAGGRFMALNLLEELDQPGEWYVDRSTKRLFFWPPPRPKNGKVFVSLLASPLISLRGASHVTLHGLTLEATRGAGIEVVGGTGVLIEGCTLRGIGTYAVSIGVTRDAAGLFNPINPVLDDGGRGNAVIGCSIQSTGEGGIVLAGGDRKTLTPAHNTAAANRIENFSRSVFTGRPAVALYGVGNIVANNLISNAPHVAVWLHGNDHLVELNEIHHVCLDTSDAGAFYMGRDLTERGNVVRYNFIHDLGPGTVQAIYLDDIASGTTVFGNVCARTGRGVQMGGGRDNLVENNIFVDCSPAVQADARGTSWAAKWFDGTDPTLMDRIATVNGTAPPYSARYPPLASLLADDPATPRGNRIVRNISVGGRWMVLLDGLTEEAMGVEGNLVGIDPGFLNPVGENFRLRSDSVAYQEGFQPIPMDRIGPAGWMPAADPGGAH